MEERIGKSRAAFAATVFLGSFLLFLVQPMLGRAMLPMFGGSAAVWGVCLAAYQTLLLGGYLYAHGLSKASLRAQGRVHVAGLAAGVAWLAVVAWWRARGGFAVGGHPWLAALGCVGAFIGLPYLILSAGSSLVQSWAVKARDPDAYRLYAWSNFGSFLGLLAYPFLLEPFLSVTAQWYALSAGMAVYTAAVFALFRFTAAGPAAAPAEEGGAGGVRAGVSQGLWYVLPAVTSFLLNAIVAHLFMDVTPLPLVMSLALSAFLLSYVLGFSRIGNTWPNVWLGLAVLSVAGAAFANGIWGTGSFYPNAAAGLSVLLFAGTYLHAWLYQERPEGGRLTKYYLANAVGGAVGGLLASFAAPALFDRVAEYPLALCAVVFLIAGRAPMPSAIRAKAGRRLLWQGVAAVLCMALVSATMRKTGSCVLYRSRNFYGTLTVTKTVESYGKTFAPVTYLWYGQTTHGLQVKTPEASHEPMAYYAPSGGGQAVLSHPNFTRGGKPINVGIVGLGAGILAAYGRPGDLYRFFDINPQVIAVAKDPSLFTYLRDTQANVDLVQGDARAMLERENAARDPLYDILFIDAYSGDSVPYHLTTKEAFEVYLRRLAPKGILAVHVSNWHIDLLPLCKSVSNALGLYAYGTVSREDGHVAGAVWVFMTRDAQEYIQLPDVRAINWDSVRDFPVPTDEKGSLLPLFRR